MQQGFTLQQYLPAEGKALQGPENKAARFKPIVEALVVWTQAEAQAGRLLSSSY